MNYNFGDVSNKIFFKFFSIASINSWVLRYDYLVIFDLPATIIAKSLVIFPYSTVLIVAYSSFYAKDFKSTFLSISALQ